MRTPRTVIISQHPNMDATTRFEFLGEAHNIETKQENDLMLYNITKDNQRQLKTR